MRRHGYGISVFGAIVLCCLFFCFPAQSDDNAVSIRVGYYEDGDYMSRGRSAEYIGFNIEFLQKLAKVGGMRYEMLDEGSWENAWHQLLEGHIDMLPAVFRTEEREKEVLFSNLPMGTLYVTLNVRVDDKRYGYEDFSSFQGMRVGSDGERFLRYCEKFGVKPIIVPYAETQALLSALEDGTLDGVAITHLGRSSTFRSVAQFSPEPVYIAVAKNRPDLLARLDAAMNAIVLRDPNYMMRLYDKYFAVSMAQQPVFTKEEEAFLKQADVVVAAYDPSWAPLEYTDTETGMFSGVTSDLLSTFSRYTGLRFRFEPIDQAEALEKVKKGLIDMVCSVTGDYLWDERNKMYTTRYYLRDCPARRLLVLGACGGGSPGQGNHFLQERTGMFRCAAQGRRGCGLRERLCDQLFAYGTPLRILGRHEHEQVHERNLFRHFQVCGPAPALHIG